MAIDVLLVFPEKKSQNFSGFFLRPSDVVNGMIFLPALSPGRGLS